MSVLVKGMEMPPCCSKCWNCDVCDGKWVCYIEIKNVREDFDKTRPDWCPLEKAEPKRDLEVVVNEACLNCELDCVEVVRCHDCRNYKEAKNGCNGFCKEWDTSTYTWDYCSRGERKDESTMGQVKQEEESRNNV